MVEDVERSVKNLKEQWAELIQKYSSKAEPDPIDEERKALEQEAERIVRRNALLSQIDVRFDMSELVVEQRHIINNAPWLRCICLMRGVTFQRCRLDNWPDCDEGFPRLGLCPRFVECDLRGIDFSDYPLDKAHFSLCDFDHATSFQGVGCIDGCRMDAYSLATLGHHRGGLTTGQLARMHIVDDLASLRRRFSGAWRWAHLVGMTVFSAPYLWFVLQQYYRSTVLGNLNDVVSVPLYIALLRFIATGGDEWSRSDWTINYFAVSTFAVVLAYNLFRAMLWVKTAILEHEQHITGLPPRFAFRSDEKLNGWGIALRLFDILSFAAVLSAVLNFWQFISRPVPLM